MRRQHREGQAASRMAVALNALFLDPFWIGISLVTSMAMDRPRTTAGTHRTKSFELIFAKLDRGASPNSSRPIKPLFSGHDEPTLTALLLTVGLHALPLIRSATLATSPLSLDNIVELLQISKASASNGTRQLSSWNAIRQVCIQGERRDHYEVIADMARLIEGICSNFLKPRLRSSDRRLTGMLSSLDQDLQRGDITQEEYNLINTRLKELGKLQNQIEKGLSLAEQLL